MLSFERAKLTHCWVWLANVAAHSTIDVEKVGLRPYNLALNDLLKKLKALTKSFSIQFFLSKMTPKRPTFSSSAHLSQL